SPGWRPSAQISAAAERVIQSKVASPTSSVIFEVDENSTEDALSSQQPSQFGHHSPLQQRNTPLVTEDQRQNDVSGGVGPPKSPEQDHTHVEHDPPTTPMFNSEV